MTRKAGTMDSRSPSQMLSLFRIALAGFLFVISVQAVVGSEMPWDTATAGMARYFVAWTPLLGSALVLIGLYARAAAFAVAFVLTCTTLLGLAEPCQSAAFAISFFYLAAVGPGPWSLDALIETDMAALRHRQ